LIWTACSFASKCECGKFEGVFFSFSFSFFLLNNTFILFWSFFWKGNACHPCDSLPRLKTFFFIKKISVVCSFAWVFFFFFVLFCFVDLVARSMVFSSSCKVDFKQFPHIHQLFCSMLHRRFGENRVPDPPRTSYLKLLIEILKDTTLVILIVAAFVAFGLAFVPLHSVSSCEDFNPNNAVPKEASSSAEYIEALAILIAVAIVANVTAMNDYSKEKQFRKLNEASRNSDVLQVRFSNALLLGLSLSLFLSHIVVVSLYHSCY
jgi:hypothetical protein